MTWLFLFFKFGTEPKDIPVNKCKQHPALCEVVEQQRPHKFEWDRKRGDL